MSSMALAPRSSNSASRLNASSSSSNASSESGATKTTLGEDAFFISNKGTLGWGLFTTLYYSVVTFTTLGFGDVTPLTRLSATIVMIEVVVGYLMLGILISILATKVARRS